jgi:hypothetical protein
VFYQDVFNVKDYGAYGNGTNDDTASISAAIDAALAASNGGAVYFPSGQYRMNSRITKTVSKSLYFFGDDESSTILSYNTLGLFNLTTASDSTIVIGFSSLELLSVDITGTAISATFLPANNTHQYTRFYAQGVSIGAVASGTQINRFTRGISLNGASNAVLDNCMLQGNCPSWRLEAGKNFFSGVGAPVTPGVNTGDLYLNTSNNYVYYWTGSWALIADVTGYANPSAVVNSGLPFRTRGTYLLEFTGTMSVNSTVTNCGFNFADIGISAQIYQEGLNVTNVPMVDVFYGILYASNSSTRSTYLTLTGVHIDQRGSGGQTAGTDGAAVRLNNVSAVLVTSSLLISDSGKAVFWMQGAYESSLTGNQIFGPAKGILIESGNFGSTSFANVITGNNFRNAGNTNIEVVAGSQTIANSNTVSDGTNAGQLIITDFTSGINTNQLWRTVMPGVNATVQKTVNQTLTTGSEVPVIWASERYSGGFDIWKPATSTSNLYVPAGAKRVRVSAGIRWGTAGGDFILKIKDQSGNSWARDNRYASAGIGAGVTIISSIIDVTASGVSSFFITAQQSTGGNLDIVADAATYFTLEVL